MLKKGYKEIFDEFAISAYIETFGVSGSIIFSKRKVYDFRSYLKTNMDLWYPYFISMLNRGIIPMAVGPEEMWTVSVQHTEDDVIQHLEAAREAAKAVIETHKFIKENW
jgi:glutamate-1-semialdehyde aminotransferase